MTTGGAQLPIAQGFNDPTFKSLSTLKKSIYILDRLVEGKSKDQIVEMCDEDERLVFALMDFLKEMQWLKQGRSTVDPIVDTFEVTSAGKAAMKKYEQKQPAMKNQQIDQQES